MLIYKITNAINNKVYVGQTIKDLKIRWSQHKSQTRYVGQNCNRKICRYLHTSMKKYGIENFFIEIIETCQNIGELNSKEVYWIKKLNSLAPNGYNLNYGGDNKKHSERTKKLLSEKLSGKNNGMFGKKGSQKQKDWLADYNKNKVISDKTLEKMKKAQQLRTSLGLNKGFNRKKTKEEIEKTRLKLCKKYIVTSPESIEICVWDMTLFCTEQNLSSRGLRRVASKDRNSHKGWKCRYA